MVINEDDTNEKLRDLFIYLFILRVECRGEEKENDTDHNIYK